MSRLSIIVALIINSALFTRVVAVEKPQPIPLNEIWGYNLPGTKDVEGIPLPDSPARQGGVGQTYDQLRRERESNVEQMRRALTLKKPTDQSSSGFIIRRQADFFALQSASMVATRKMRDERAKEELTSDTFRVGDDLTLCFFTHPSSYYVRLREVKLANNTIKVRYQFEPHTTPDATVHFALIPIGKLPAGEYRVDYEQIPLEQKYREIGFDSVEPDAATMVCRDFTLKVIDLPKSNQAPSKDAALIPLRQIWAYDMPDTRRVSELEPQLPGAGDMPDDEFIRRHQIQQILRALHTKPKDKAGPAFVVTGTGKEALKNARDVFVKEKEPAKVLPADVELTLVFFSYMSSRYVQIELAEMIENQITVKYRIVSHQTDDMSTHFALIPLGKLTVGVKKVVVQQVESNNVDDQRRPPLSDPHRYISDSFSFEVRR